MSASADVELRWLRAGDEIDPATARGLVDCWHATVEAGGAVGFPWPPVERAEVATALDAQLAEVAGGTARLLVADDAVGVAGWVVLVGNARRLTAHWASVLRLQSHPRARGRGVGSMLLSELTRAAREDLGLEQLHLTVRGGMDLERFYGSRGWREVGRWPGALRLAPGDDRDEVLFVREL